MSIKERFFEMDMLARVLVIMIGSLALGSAGVCLTSILLKLVMVFI